MNAEEETRKFAEWLDERRDMSVAECFHEIVEQFATNQAVIEVLFKSIDKLVEAFKNIEVHT
jgi:hypothetical protein